MPFQQVKVQDYSMQAAEDIVSILTNPPDPNNPTAGNPVWNVPLQIATQLKGIDPLPSPPPNGNNSPNNNVHHHCTQQ